MLRFIALRRAQCAIIDKDIIDSPSIERFSVDCTLYFVLAHSMINIRQITAQRFLQGNIKVF